MTVECEIYQFFRIVLVFSVVVELQALKEEKTAAMSEAAELADQLAVAQREAEVASAQRDRAKAEVCPAPLRGIGVLSSVQFLISNGGNVLRWISGEFHTSLLHIYHLMHQGWVSEQKRARSFVPCFLLSSHFLTFVSSPPSKTCLNWSG